MQCVKYTYVFSKVKRARWQHDSSINLLIDCIRQEVRLVFSTLAAVSSANIIIRHSKKNEQTIIRILQHFRYIRFVQYGICSL